MKGRENGDEQERNGMKKTILIGITLLILFVAVCLGRYSIYPNKSSSSVPSAYKLDRCPGQVTYLAYFREFQIKQPPKSVFADKPSKPDLNFLSDKPKESEEEQE